MVSLGYHFVMGVEVCYTKIFSFLALANPVTWAAFEALGREVESVRPSRIGRVRDFGRTSSTSPPVQFVMVVR